MSRRRESWQPHATVSADDLYRVHYGEQKVRDPADLTVVPAAEDFDPWLAALKGLTLAVFWFSVVVAAWVTVLPLLVRGGA